MTPSVKIHIDKNAEIFVLPEEVFPVLVSEENYLYTLKNKIVNCNRSDDRPKQRINFRLISREWDSTFLFFSKTNFGMFFRVLF